MSAMRASTHQSSRDLLVEPRARAVLTGIIERHVVTGEPVGSRVIAEYCGAGAGWSPATIRNIMAELEEAGLVEQPHTSAGRVPTDRGYRYYVDHVMDDVPLAKGDLQAIQRIFFSERIEAVEGADRLMEEISRLLSAVSDNVGIVVSPSLSDTRLQHIEFLKLSDNRLLVVIVSAPNIIQNRIIRADESFSQEELERMARYLNTEFSGKTLSQIRSEIFELMKREKAIYDRCLRNAILLCEQSLDDEDLASGDVYVEGASNILTKPDFNDVERVRQLFKTFEEKSRLLKILNECVSREIPIGNVQVMIGRENTVPSMQNCALITTTYRIGSDAVGTLGIVGPMRIEYARIRALVKHVAGLVEQKLQQEADS
jgi:heat-inducible transcriptional repressor